eukprot:CAMPEP_0117774472 /NCGR_PEP_ID=MMETSP0947-20121206/26533_1 /TAXON_ID=44440 /ORGANISM="Chattonella subsalsa, Strain CCMP2191" /LENGTH=468 /DNA_ID=CAMNT_0005600935 /DNA_START=139 /DNA_END=1545 /DNA_ORIENTATION=-
MVMQAQDQQSGNGAQGIGFRKRKIKRPTQNQDDSSDSLGSDLSTGNATPDQCQTPDGGQVSTPPTSHQGQGSPLRKDPLLATHQLKTESPHHPPSPPIIQSGPASPMKQVHISQELQKQLLSFTSKSPHPAHSERLQPGAEDGFLEPSAGDWRRNPPWPGTTGPGKEARGLPVQSLWCPKERSCLPLSNTIQIPYQMRFKKRSTEDVITRNAACQVEMDEALVIRMLDLRKQGTQESYCGLTVKTDVDVSSSSENYSSDTSGFGMQTQTLKKESTGLLNASSSESDSTVKAEDGTQEVKAKVELLSQEDLKRLQKQSEEKHIALLKQLHSSLQAHHQPPVTLASAPVSRMPSPLNIPSLQQLTGIEQQSLLSASQAGHLPAAEGQPLFQVLTPQQAAALGLNLNPGGVLQLQPQQNFQASPKLHLDAASDVNPVSASDIAPNANPASVLAELGGLDDDISELLLEEIV